MYAYYEIISINNCNDKGIKSLKNLCKVLSKKKKKGVFCNKKELMKISIYLV